MKIKLVMLAFLLSTLTIHAQKFRGEASGTNTGFKVALDAINNSRVATENVFAPTANEECGLQVDRYIFGSTISGMNGFGDLQKAQRLHFEGSDAYHVIGVAAFITYASVVGDGNLYMNIYSVNENDGGPEEYLGSPDPVAVSDLVPPDSVTRELNATIFVVSDDSVMQITQSSFYVSYDFSELYFTEDTVEVGQTPDMCGAEDDTWEQFFPDDTSDLVWGPVAQTWQLNFDLHVAAVVEFDELVSADDYIASQDLKIFPATPNPAREFVQLNYELDGLSDVTFEVFDIKGSKMYRVVRENVGLGRQGEIIDVSHFPDGSYYYRIATEKGEMMSRFMVSE